MTPAALLDEGLDLDRLDPDALDRLDRLDRMGRLPGYLLDLAGGDGTEALLLGLILAPVLDRHRERKEATA